MYEEPFGKQVDTAALIPSILEAFLDVMARGLVTDQHIERALSAAARLIECYGDAYWPIFEQPETELELRHSRAARLKQRLNPKTTRKSLCLLHGKAQDKPEPKVIKPGGNPDQLYVEKGEVFGR